MNLILIIILLIIVFGGGGGYYGYQRFGASGGLGGGLGLILIFLVIAWLLGVFR